ncbi:SUMF1/EgtB/PvdO family nonheme iron enzyme [Candidatus Kaiserbacteria bacterium]|nr:SUMF1/EgtB/PvdO family nonheme iron enzyme [Candidatus Kaiserbacteria bacterium]
MNKLKNSPIILILVITLATIVTSIGIDASDTLSGSSATLLARLIHDRDEAGCPTEMVAVDNTLTFGCVDKYEASAGLGCSFATIDSELDTLANIENPNCRSQSVAGLTPWRYVSRDQAQLLCTRSGKRLPSSSEWYQFAIGTSEVGCNTKSGNVDLTGRQSECQSANGVYDAVGNLWEWTNDDVFAGELSGRVLPDSGYVTSVDSSGVATETSLKASDDYNNDYWWSDEAGNFGLIRGGYYGSGDDGGVYAIHADILPHYRGAALGFRCVI